LEERKNNETTANIHYLWGSRHRDDLVRRDRAATGTTFNETRYVMMDYFNPMAIVDQVGAVKERYAFSAFGKRRILAPDWSSRTTSECLIEFAFQGQFVDPESGLMNYGFRYYSPALGRWTCKDPIGERGGLNLFDVLMNNPINGTDFLGLLLPPSPNAPLQQTIPNFLKDQASREGLRQGDLPNVLRGCIGVCSAYQAQPDPNMRNLPPQKPPGLRGQSGRNRPEEADDTFCSRGETQAENDGKDKCNDGSYFVFAKQGNWKDGKAPPDDATSEQLKDSVVETAEVSFDYISKVPGAMAGSYINADHQFRSPDDPGTIFISPTPPKTNQNRPAEIWCVTCRCGVKS
jgi:RHS repeat-associated protein